MTHRTSLALLFACLLLGASLRAQQAVTIGGVNVRAARTSSSKSLAHLDSGVTVSLLSSGATGGYYKVRTASGISGWAWAARLDTKAQPVDTTSGGPGSIDPHWQKTPTNAATYKWPDTDTSCVAGGTGTPNFFDPLTNVWKNRTDEPASYHDVTWDAITALEVPRDSTRYRVNWSPADLAKLAAYEGTPIRVVAFLSGAKQEIPSGKNGQPPKGESTNCGEAAPAHVDWHIYLTKQPHQTIDQSVVIETTPRVRFLPQHSKLSFDSVQASSVRGDTVRVSGWLMFDPEHYDQMYKYDPANLSTASKYRITLWEIHPITKLEIRRNGAWVSLDQVP